MAEQFAQRVDDNLVILSVWQPRNRDRADHACALHDDRKTTADAGVVGGREEVALGDVLVLLGKLIPDPVGAAQEALHGVGLAPYPIVIVGGDAGPGCEEQRAVEAPDVDDQGPGVGHSLAVQGGAELPCAVFIEVWKLQGLFLAKQKCQIVFQAHPDFLLPGSKGAWITDPYSVV